MAFHTLTNYIEIDALYHIKDQATTKQIDINNISSELKKADILTQASTAHK